jgi:hypothetical protein
MSSNLMSMINNNCFSDNIHEICIGSDSSIHLIGISITTKRQHSHTNFLCLCMVFVNQCRRRQARSGEEDGKNFNARAEISINSSMRKIASLKSTDSSMKTKDFFAILRQDFSILSSERTVQDCDVKSDVSIL